MSTPCLRPRTRGVDGSAIPVPRNGRCQHVEATPAVEDEPWVVAGLLDNAGTSIRRGHATGGSSPATCATDGPRRRRTQAHARRPQRDRPLVSDRPSIVDSARRLMQAWSPCPATEPSRRHRRSGSSTPIPKVAVLRHSSAPDPDYLGRTARPGRAHGSFPWARFHVQVEGQAPPGRESGGAVRDRLSVSGCAATRCRFRGTCDRSRSVYSSWVRRIARSRTARSRWVDEYLAFLLGIRRAASAGRTGHSYLCVAREGLVEDSCIP